MVAEFVRIPPSDVSNRREFADKREAYVKHPLTGVAVMFGVFWGTAVLGDDPSPQAVTFEEHVLPILKARCVRCHAGAEPQAGLWLLSRKDLLARGKSGPAIRLNAAESFSEQMASTRLTKTTLSRGFRRRARKSDP
jgi:hypothetical protein